MFKLMRLRNTFGFGFSIDRDYYNEYKWWEFELHIAFAVWYLTIEVNSHV